MNDDLKRVTVPGEQAAAERVWRVIATAHARREPVTRPSRRTRVAVVALAGAALAAGALVAAPGRAVLDGIREVVGVERAQPALFSLPSAGRLLVRSDAGIWVVDADGSKRLLGDYREASWSPYGRFVVAARANELAALEPDGDVRWTLARRSVRSPRWGGTRDDTRIAYVDRSGIRVVAGDGTGDRLLVRGAGGPLAWRPGKSFVLAHVASESVRVLDADSGRVVWHAARPRGSATDLLWSSDGRRLLVLSPHHVRVYDARGRVVGGEDPSEGWPDVAAAFRPGSHTAAVSRVHGSQSTAYVLGGRALFNGTGVFRGLAWSPDGRWLLVTWPTADQWVFVPASGRRIRAVANVTEQFRTDGFPRVEGWCCGVG